VINQLIIGW